MKAVVIKGSARNLGNTEKLCVGVFDGLRSRDVAVTVFRPIEMRIAHCTHCGGCVGTGVCVIDDDMRKIYEAVIECDIIVFCTPVHFLGVSSVLKQVFDRFQCFWEKQPDNKRRIAALVASAGSNEVNLSIVKSICVSVANTVCADWKGDLIQIGCDAGNSNSKEELLKAYGFGRSLTMDL